MFSPSGPTQRQRSRQNSRALHLAHGAQLSASSIHEVHHMDQFAWAELISSGLDHVCFVHHLTSTGHGSMRRGYLIVGPCEALHL